MTQHVLYVNDRRNRPAIIEAKAFAYWHSWSKRTDRTLTPSSFLVYTALVFAADREIPGIQDLANECGINRDTVASCLKSLEREGLIRKTANGYDVLDADHPWDTR